jgi:tight adherence protein C
MSELGAATLQIAACIFAAGAASALALAARRPALVLSRPRPLAALASLNERHLPAAWLEVAQAALRKAGRPRRLRAAELIALVQIGGGAALACGALVAWWLSLPASVALAFAGFGAAAPALWLHDKVKARERSIVRALPFDLDLLTLSVEAGLDFAAALAKVVEKGRKGPLADELSIALKELRLGKTREEALRNLAARAGVPVLTSFVQALIQADRMGTPLGKVLRVLSTQMRTERTHRAEKLANEAPVKLLFPLICFILPTLFLMLFGPIAHQMFFSGTF